MTHISNIIFGLQGTHLTSEEKFFFQSINPLGFILFKRNIDNAAQVIQLITSLRECVDHQYPLFLVDQEGGRVARLRPPEFRESSPIRHYGKIAEENLSKGKDAVYQHHFLMGQELASLGFNVNCAPVADLLYEQAHQIIGDRSFGRDPSLVSELCNDALNGLRDANIQGIIKHIPGHGLANMDSHLDLPIVKEDLNFLLENDFKVFKLLHNAKIAMTAHIIYEALDTQHPATTSNKVIHFIRNELGFRGLIITDDLSMKALANDVATNGLQALAAGCDILLHCNGDIEEMKSFSTILKPLDPNQLSLISNFDCFNLASCVAI